MEFITYLGQFQQFKNVGTSKLNSLGENQVTCSRELFFVHILQAAGQKVGHCKQRFTV